MRVHRNVRPRRLPRARACGFLATEGDGLCRPVSRQENERCERLAVRTQIPGHLSRQFRSNLIRRTVLVRTCAEVAGIRSNGFSWLEFVCYAYGAARPSPTLHTRHVVSTPTWYTNRNLLRNKRYFKYMYMYVYTYTCIIPGSNSRGTAVRPAGRRLPCADNRQAVVSSAVAQPACCSKPCRRNAARNDAISSSLRCQRAQSRTICSSSRQYTKGRAGHAPARSCTRQR